MPYADPERQQQYYRDYDKSRVEKRRAYRKANRERLCAYMREYGRTHRKEIALRLDGTKEQRKKYGREWSFRKKYGKTEAEILALYESQDYKCAICGADMREKKGALGMHMDHCHKTGLLRSGLCPPCNQGLGYFRDNGELLSLAAMYLKNWSDKHATKGQEFA